VSDWSGKRALVTGAEGFIGSHLAERLVELGADVRALVQYNSFNSWGWLESSAVRSEIDVTLGDVRDRDSLAKPTQGADVVFHLAALIAIPYSYSAPQSYVDTNVSGTLNVLRAAAEAETDLVVHTSTSEVYGTARYVPMDEGHPLQAQSPYAASKIGADKIVESFHHSFGLPVVTLRPFNTYGPRQSSRAVIPTIVTQALMGTAIELGNITPTRDFTFVTDTAEAFVAAGCTAAAVGKVLNIGSGAEISIRQVAERICALLGKEALLQIDEARTRPADSEVERLHADASQAREVLGWEPQYELNRGLSATIEWIEANLDSFKVDSYVV
jgi:NAD dependent epimerase/dehydratase